jgi:hypothetical protein
VQKIETAVRTLTEDPDYQAQAKKLQVALFYQDAATTKSFWQNIDKTFGPIVATYRAQQ